MKHARRLDLIRLAAGELPERDRAEVERHLATCPACRSLYEQQAATWRALGEWAPETAHVDLLAQIDRKLSERPATRPPFWSGVQRVSRIAAAVVVGVGAGYAATLAWPPGQTPQPAPATAEANELAATEQLGVEYLANESPAGLFAALDELPMTNDFQEDQS